MVGLLAITAWTAIIVGGVFLALKCCGYARVSEDDERHGLDIVKHGGSAYEALTSDNAMLIASAELGMRLPAFDGDASSATTTTSTGARNRSTRMHAGGSQRPRRGERSGRRRN